MKFARLATALVVVALAGCSEQSALTPSEPTLNSSPPADPGTRRQNWGTVVTGPGETSPAFAMDYAAGAGAGWIRVNIYWHLSQESVPTGNCEAQVPLSDYTHLNQIIGLINAAKAKNIQVFASFGDITPGWAQARAGDPYSGPHPALYCWWRAFVRETVRHVDANTGGYVQHWGVWNEPNGPSHTTGITPRIDAVEMASVAAYAADGINANGAKQVVGPLLAHDSPAGSSAYLNTFLQHAGHRINKVAIHVYNPPDGAVNHIQAMGSIASSYGKPLWVTEVGASHGWDRPQHADVVARIGMEPWLYEKVFVYNLTNDQAGYGLVTGFPVSPSRTEAYECFRWIGLTGGSGLPTTYGCDPNPYY